MRKILVPSFIICFMLLLSQCRKPEPFEAEEYDERMSGGSQTAFDATSGAFRNAFSGMSEYDDALHGVGDAGFDQKFVTSTGLGPAFNNISCSSCHHGDGRGVPSVGEGKSAMLLRISYPGTDEHNGAIPVHGYGTQIQDQAIYGSEPETKITMTYTDQQYSFSDGSTYSLRTPAYELSNQVIGALTSPRLAPPVFGLGLLEAIPEEQILALADPNDRDGDGIKGKPNYVWNPYTQRKELGRFGLKLNTSTLQVQVAAAYNNDIGITSYVFKNETSEGQPEQMDTIVNDPELSDSVLNAVVFYMKSLQVPARRNVTDPQVIRGKQLFKEVKCASCHNPDYTTATNVAFPATSNQRIHPYTDMLLHDMGEGLADHRPDFDADGFQWRTTPLWGLGLIATVNYPPSYLHDGRARSILEAIMWHGGEAQQSRENFEHLSKADRDALIKFLQSL